MFSNADMLYMNQFVNPDLGFTDSTKKAQFKAYIESKKPEPVPQNQDTEPLGVFKPRVFEEQKRTIVIDSRHRNMIMYPDASNFIIDLPQVYTNVSKMRFVANVFPNVDQAINSGNNTFRWINKEDIDLGFPEYIATMANGSYRTLENLRVEMELKLNSIDQKRRQGTGVPHFFVIRMSEDTDQVMFTNILAKQVPTNGVQTLQGTGLITITQPNHGYRQNETIEVLGIRGTVGGISANVLNGRFEITVINQNQFRYEVASISTASEEGGGSLIKTGRETEWQLIGQYQDTILEALGFRVENSSIDFPTGSTLTSQTKPIQDIIQQGSQLWIVSPGHSLQIGDFVYLHEFFVTPSVYAPPNRGRFEIVNVPTPDVFVINFVVDSITSIRLAYAGTQNVKCIFPNHGFNRIIDIQQVSSGVVELTTLFDHQYDLLENNMVCIHNSNSVPSVDGYYQIVAIPSPDTMHILFSNPIVQPGFKGILTSDHNIVLYNIPAFGGFREFDLNGQYFEIRDIVSESEFTFLVRTGFSSQEQTIHVANSGRIHSKLHGWQGTITNYDSQTQRLYRPVNLSGESYSYILCPNLPDSENYIMTTASSEIKNIIGVLLLTASPGFTIFNNTIDTEIKFTKPIQSLSELHLRHVNPSGHLLNFNGLDYMLMVEITELVDKTENVNMISNPLVVQ